MTDQPTLSALDLAAIAARADAATPVPWLVADGENRKPVVYVERPMPDGRVGALVLWQADNATEADAQFTAGARERVPALLARVAELEARLERRQARLVALENDALNMRGSLSPNGQDRKVPFPLGETLTPAVDWLIGRIAELETERDAFRNQRNAVFADNEKSLARVDEAQQARLHAENETRKALHRVAELEAQAASPERNKIRSSFTELIAQAEQDRDYEGAASLQHQLAEREEQWKRADSAAPLPGSPAREKATEAQQ